MGTRNSYIILVLIRNVNSFSNIFLFYSPKDSTADFSFTPSVCYADSPLSEGAFPLLRAKQASLPEGGGCTVGADRGSYFFLKMISLLNT